jgi:hypothetical protein
MIGHDRGPKLKKSRRSAKSKPKIEKALPWRCLLFEKQAG